MVSAVPCRIPLPDFGIRVMVGPVGRSKPPARGCVRMVDQWWQIPVRPNQTVDLIQELFLMAFAAAGRPRGAALFENDIAERRTALYVTPSAATFAQTLLRGWGGKPCLAPASGYFLVGDEKAQNLLPPPD